MEYSSRLHYQLKRDAAMRCSVLRMVPMKTGHAALCAEKDMHRQLKQAFPAAPVDPAEWQGQIRVGTEIYDSALESVILGMLDRLEADQAAA